MSVNRRALVVRSGQAIDIMTRESLGVRPSILGTPSAIARPGVGGNTTGLHYQPVPNVDQVTVLGEVGDHMSTAVCSFDPTKLPSMNDGETVIWGPQGQVLAYALAAGGARLYSDTNGTSIVIDTNGNLTITAGAGKNINLVTSAGGQLQGNGTQITVP